MSGVDLLCNVARAYAQALGFVVLMGVGLWALVRLGNWLAGGPRCDRHDGTEDDDLEA